MRKIVRTPDFPIVETSLGKLHGFQKDDVFHFHGIRYGTAERFQLPVMEEPWEGVKDAKSYGYVCPLMPGDMQAQCSTLHDPSDVYNPMAQPFCTFEMPHVFWPMSEQCLYLNVFTKHLEKDAKRPVLVWLHGGGYGSGSSIELPSYDGHNFTDYGDVVFVSLNHRLNCAGFLDLSLFGEKYKYSGIAGMADIVLALRWVHDNIEAFGGDPQNVTVAGQSGGGGKAAMLLQMPEADGLYHKIISQSGALIRVATESLEEEKKFWQELGKRTAEKLGLDENSIDRICNIPFEQLSAATDAAGREMGREPGMMLLAPSPVEGYYTGSFEFSGFRKETKDIPVIAGTVLGEFNFMHYLGDKNKYRDHEKLEMLRGTFGENTEKILTGFKELYPDKDILYALSIDIMFRPGTVRFLNKRAAFLKEQGSNAGCWNYLFSIIIPYLGGIALYHCGDIPFVFRNVESENVICTLGDGAGILQDQASDAWLSFMKNNDPSTPDLPWPEYTLDKKARLVFDTQSAVSEKDDSDFLQMYMTYMESFFQA